MFQLSYIAGPFEYPFTANHGACSYDSYLDLFSMLLQHIFESGQTRGLLERLLIQNVHDKRQICP